MNNFVAISLEKLKKEKKINGKFKKFTKKILKYNSRTDK